MFPEGCGYRSETGGLMERLRELSVEKSKKERKGKKDDLFFMTKIMRNFFN